MNNQSKFYPFRFFYHIKTPVQKRCCIYRRFIGTVCIDRSRIHPTAVSPKWHQLFIITDRCWKERPCDNATKRYYSYFKSNTFYRQLVNKKKKNYWRLSASNNNYENYLIDIISMNSFFFYNQSNGLTSSMRLDIIL